VAWEPKRLTRNSTEISAIAIVIIDSPVGRPMRNTLANSARSMRKWRRKAASGASARPWRSRWRAVQARAIRYDATAAQAPLVTPIIGKPSQPRISAGVSRRPTAVEISKVSRGVRVSPTPRNMEVTSRKVNTPGAAISMMRA
jgi:hypothetical protein